MFTVPPLIFGNTDVPAAGTVVQFGGAVPNVMLFTIPGVVGDGQVIDPATTLDRSRKQAVFAAAGVKLQLAPLVLVPSSQKMKLGLNKLLVRRIGVKPLPALTHTLSCAFSMQGCAKV